MRRHSDLSLDQALRVQESLTVPCDPPSSASRRGLGQGRGVGCGAPIGQRCTNIATGAPLEGLGAHVGRLTRARAARAAAVPEQRPGPELART